MKRRTRIAQGVFRDKYGIAVTVKVGGQQKETRFPKGTLGDDPKIRAWKTDIRAELERLRPDGPKAVRGTVQHETHHYIALRGLTPNNPDCAHLRAWLPAFGTIALTKLTRKALQAQIDTWHRAGVAARTIRHRCRLLRALYRGAKPCPVDHLTLPRLPVPRPIAVSLDTIRTVARRLAESRAVKTRARFLIRVITGQRPAQIGRTKPEDIDYGRRLWFVRSAKGGHAIPFPLNDEAIRAWKLFAAADAWGPFSTKKHAARLRQYGWPKQIRPIALRSTFAIDLLLSGADIGDVQGLLGHTQIETTRRHYAPVLVARLQTVTAGRSLGLVPADDCQPTSRKPTESFGKTRKRNHAGKTIHRRKSA